MTSQTARTAEPLALPLDVSAPPSPPGKPSHLNARTDLHSLPTARRRPGKGQPQLAALIPPCPHCGSALTHLELPLADDGNIEADRHRCDTCGRHYWQLTLPGTGRRQTVR